MSESSLLSLPGFQIEVALASGQMIGGKWRFATNFPQLCFCCRRLEAIKMLPLFSTPNTIQLPRSIKKIAKPSPLEMKEKKNNQHFSITRRRVSLLMASNQLYFFLFSHQSDVYVICHKHITSILFYSNGFRPKQILIQEPPIKTV